MSWRYCLKHNDRKNHNKFWFQFDHIYFTDYIRWSFELGFIKVAADLQAGDDQEAVTPYEAYAQMIYRPNNDHAEGHFFITQLDGLVYKVVPSLTVRKSTYVIIKPVHS